MKERNIMFSTIKELKRKSKLEYSHNTDYKLNLKHILVAKSYILIAY